MPPSGGDSVNNPPIVQTSSLQPSSQADPIVRKANELALNLIQKPPKVPDPVGFDPLQKQGQEQFVQAAQGPIQGLVDQTFGAQSFLTDPSILNASSNPHLQSYIDAALGPITERFETSVLPNIRSGAIANNALGGSRQGVAEGLATSNYLRQLGDTTAGIAFPAYQAGLDTLFRGVQQAPTTAGFGLLPGTILDVVGNQRRELEQRKQGNQFINQVLPFLFGRDAADLAVNLPGGVTAQTSVQGAGPREPGTFQKTTGGLATGTAIGNVIGATVGFPMLGSVLGALAGGVGANLA